MKSENTSPASSVRLATKGEMFGYMWGGFGSNIAFGLAISFLMPFFNSVLGVGASAVGVLFVVARAIDAFTDPLMGMISDRTRSKWGRYRPYVMFGAPFLGLVLVLLFSTPGFVSGVSLAEMPMSTRLLYAYIMYISYSLISTVVNIPYHALTAVMSTELAQRNMLSSLKQAMANIALVLVSAFSLPIIKMFSKAPNPLAQYGINPGDALPEGIAQAVGKKVGDLWNNDYLLLDADAWRNMAIIWAVLLTASFIMCGMSAKRHDKLSVAITGEGITFGASIKMLFQNKSILLLMASLGSDVLALAGANALNLYYWQYVLGNTSPITTISLVSVLISIPVILLIPSLAKKFGKRLILSAGSVLTAVIYTIIFFIPNPAENVQLIVILFIAGTVAAAIPGSVAWAMLPDCVEYGEWKSGVRGEGAISGMLTFVNKLGMAFGGLTAGLFLAAIGFIEPVSGVAQVQPGSVLSGLSFIRLILPIFGYVCTVVAMMFYDTDKLYPQIIADLNERRMKAQQK